MYEKLYRGYYFGRRAVASSDISMLPNVMEWEGMMDLLMVIIQNELSSVIDPRTYEEDGVPSLDRESVIQARKAARDILGWLCQYFDLVNTNSTVVSIRCLS